MTNLYYIENCGCDDTTHGLVELDDEEVSLLTKIFRNLNKNSTYGCMPKIHMYKIPESLIRRPKEGDCREEILYTNTGEYVLDGRIEEIDFTAVPTKFTLKEGVEEIV